MAQKKTARKKNRKIRQKPVKTGMVSAVVALCLSLALVVSVLVVTSKPERQPQQVFDFGKAEAQGIDVSEHNGEIDWEALSGKIDFAFIRAGYRAYGNGVIRKDVNAEKNMDACEKAGIPYGVYFYSQAITEAEAQAEAKFTLTLIKDRNPQLPVFIDFEYAADSGGSLTGRLYEKGLSRAKATDIVNAFCQEVEKADYLSGVYASSSMLAHKLNQSKFGENTLVWVADYNSSVTYSVDYTIWQYSKTGELEEIQSKYVDLNIWYN